MGNLMSVKKGQAMRAGTRTSAVPACTRSRSQQPLRVRQVRERVAAIEWMDATKTISKRMRDLASHRVSMATAQSTQHHTDEEENAEQSNFEACAACLSNTHQHAEISPSCHGGIGTSLFGCEGCQSRMRTPTHEEHPAAFSFGFDGDQYGSMSDILGALPSSELAELRARSSQSVVAQ